MSNIIKFPKEIEQPAAPAPVEPAAAPGGLLVFSAISDGTQS